MSESHNNNYPQMLKIAGLPDQQMKCLALLASGFTVKKIAHQLNLSIRTVEHYISHIRKKTACRSSLELVCIYYQYIIHFLTKNL